MALSPAAQLEALLFAAGEPLKKKQLAELIGIDTDLLDAGLEALRRELTERGLTLIETDEEVELRTSPEAAPLVQRLRESELSRDIGKASLETLAFILYRGTATRGEIDWVRGVNSSAAVRTLLMRGLIERFEDPSDKRRARYKATIDALAHLGVSRLEDLPRYAEFSATMHEQEVRASETSTDTP